MSQRLECLSRGQHVAAKQAEHTLAQVGVGGATVGGDAKRWTAAVPSRETLKELPASLELPLALVFYKAQKPKLLLGFKTLHPKLR